MRVVGRNRGRGTSIYKFFAKMKFKDIQRELCIYPGYSPEETLRSALLQETGYSTASTLQKQMGKNYSSNYSNQSSNNQFRVKQEPTLSVQKKNLRNRINRAKNQNSTFKKQNKPTDIQKACYFSQS